MVRLGDVVMGTLMILDANSDAEEVAVDAVASWMASRVDDEGQWRSIVQRDQRVVFGSSHITPDAGDARARL